MTCRRILLLAVLVAPVALWARWHGSPEARAPYFHPRPDALEYAASAQSIAQTGRFFLQIGPIRVRPRYPPGWPLLLAGALRLGVDSTDLWRMTGAFGAVLAWAVAVAAAWLARSLSAGLLAGWLWSLAPVAAGAGRTLLSDEPAALFAVAALLLTGLSLLFDAKPRRLNLCATLGGLSLGLTAAMRPIAACLLAPPLAVLLIAALRRSGIRPLLPRLAAWTLGAAIFPALAMVLLYRSSLQPTEWSGYAFWIPERYARLSDTFSLSYALQPDEDFSLGAEGEPLSHLGIAVRVLLGLPGLRARHSLGLLWPALGWLAAIPLFRTVRRREGPAAALAPWISTALLLWVAGHVLVFSLYFYPSSRFYLGPLALCTVLLSAACALVWTQSGLRARAPAVLAAFLALLLTARGWTDLQKEPLPEERDERTRSRFARWRDRTDEERAGRIVPFDPLYAQALGLLSPEVADSVHVWGELPPTTHVRRLRALGIVPPEPSPMR